MPQVKRAAAQPKPKPTPLAQKAAVAMLPPPRVVTERTEPYSPRALEHGFPELS